MRLCISRTPAREKLQGMLQACSLQLANLPDRTIDHHSRGQSTPHPRARHPPYRLIYRTTQFDVLFSPDQQKTRFAVKIKVLRKVTEVGPKLTQPRKHLSGQICMFLPVFQAFSLETCIQVFTLLTNAQSSRCCKVACNFGKSEGFLFPGREWCERV
jgi:hypothetical protein